MIKVVEIEAFGFEPVPWSVPNIGVSTTRSGKRVRFARRAKKGDIDKGKLNLAQWQNWVKLAAEKAMAGKERITGPVHLAITFYAETPDGCVDGQLWDGPLKWNKKTKKFGKAQPRGKTEADLCNLFKGTEDALEGVVFENDVQTRSIGARTIFGPQPGVRVVAYAIEATDHPGPEKE